MSALSLIAALAAQTTAPTGTAAPETAAPAASTRASSIGSYTYVDLEGGAGYSTNPNLVFGDNTGAGFGRLSAHAVHTRVSTRTTTVLSGFAQNIFYVNRYGLQPSFSLTGRHDAQVNEKLQLFGDVGFSYDEGGQLDTRILTLPNVPPAPGVTEPTLINPAGDFVSVRGKHYVATGNLGGQLALGPRDFMTLTGGAEHVVFKSGGFDTHYTSIPLSLGYERQLSARTTVGARVAAQFTNYDGPVDTRVITPQLTIQTLISERMTLSGAVGASFVSTDNGSLTDHSTGLAANASLCSAGEHDHFCARAGVDQEGTTVVGPARTITAGVDYSRQLDANQTIAFSVSGTRYSRPSSTVFGPFTSDSTYARGAADYSRRLSDRWFGGVGLAARKTTQAGPDPKVDFSGSLYIRYRLGDLR
jgi:hypothetical protein